MKNVFPVILGAVIVGGAIYHYQTQPPLFNVVAAGDVSASLVRNCHGFAQSVTASLKHHPGIREGSKLTMLIMGKNAANPEPVPVFTADIPIDNDVVIGGDPEAYEAAQRQLLGGVEQACTDAQTSPQSPVYQMVRQAIALLHGADGKGHGYVVLKSDLDDDAHPLLRTVLQEAVQNPDVTVPKELAGSLDNTNVAIHVCGTGELAPRKHIAATAPFDTRLRIWKAMLTHPELVTTQPFCGAGQSQ